MNANSKSTYYIDLFKDNPRNEDESIRKWCRRLSDQFGQKPNTYRRQYDKVKEMLHGEAPVPSVASSGKVQDRAEWKEQRNEAEYTYSGRKRIITLEDALNNVEVDLSVWCVDRFVANNWEVTMKGDQGEPIRETNYQVKVWFKKIADSDIDWKLITEQLQGVLKKRKSFKPKKSKGSGKAMVLTSDFHLGAYVDNLIRSERFNIEVLVNRLEDIAELVNSWELEEVHVGMLGDFIESFTGLNHRNVWKGLSKGMYGMGAVQLCFEVLCDHFLYKINNLKGVYLVSGNHDRVTSARPEDTKGEVGNMLAWLLRRELSENIELKFHNMVVTVEVDGICYVLAHGDKGFSQKEISKVLFEYGIQGKYNVLAQGHKHTRKVTKSRIERAFSVADIEIVQIDECDYRAITVSPLFTGNFYSESLGFSSSAGFNLIQNNGKGKVNIHDYCV